MRVAGVRESIVHVLERKELQKECRHSHHLASVLHSKSLEEGNNVGTENDNMKLLYQDTTAFSVSGPKGSLTQVVVILGLADLLVHTALSFL